jgi:hypothetical protein
MEDGGIVSVPSLGPLMCRDSRFLSFSQVHGRAKEENWTIRVLLDHLIRRQTRQGTMWSEAE